MKRSIAIDMDGVLADIESHFFDWYEKDYGIRLCRKDVEGKMEVEAFPEKEAVWRYVFTPGFFRTIPLMPGAVEAVSVLMEDFDVFIVSAAMEFPQSLSEKLEWLKEHFPFISWRNIIFCGDKSKIDTDFLIDDHCKNLDHCKGKAIMFDAFHNIHYDHHFRVKNWDEVLVLFRKELQTTNIQLSESLR